MAQVVAAGIDTLNVGFNVDGWNLDESAFRQLDDAKLAAGVHQFGGKGVTVSLGGREFCLLAKGAMRHEYVMYNDDIRLGLARECHGGLYFPEVYVQMNSSFLWGKGYLQAFAELLSWLCGLASVGGEKMSRVDLCVDVATELPRLDVAREAVTRARNKVDYFEVEHYTQGRRDTGYRFGSGRVMARL